MKFTFVNKPSDNTEIGKTSLLPGLVKTKKHQIKENKKPRKSNNLQGFNKTIIFSERFCQYQDGFKRSLRS